MSPTPPGGPRIDDGGPAFPRAHAEFEQGDESQDGMSLRDHFAGLAMGGYLATFTGADTVHPAVNPNNAREIAALSYELADAMLEARARR